MIYDTSVLPQAVFTSSDGLALLVQYAAEEAECPVNTQPELTGGLFVYPLTQDPGRAVRLEAILRTHGLYAKYHEGAPYIYVEPYAKFGNIVTPPQFPGREPPRDEDQRTLEDIRRVMRRINAKGTVLKLFSAMYHAPDGGLSIPELANEMDVDEEVVETIISWLGRKIALTSYINTRPTVTPDGHVHYTTLLFDQRRDKYGRHYWARPEFKSYMEEEQLVSTSRTRI